MSSRLSALRAALSLRLPSSPAAALLALRPAVSLASRLSRLCCCPSLASSPSDPQIRFAVIRSFFGSIEISLLWVFRRLRVNKKRGLCGDFETGAFSRAVFEAGTMRGR